MRVLITGFEPFGGESVNPSAMLMPALANLTIAGLSISTLALPVSFDEIPVLLERTISRVKPQVVLGFGLAGGRPAISIERVAINVIDARIPDNAGSRPVDKPVVPHGPAAYFSTVPIKAMLIGLREIGIPVTVSQSAGTFVCNAHFYLIRHLASTRFPGIRCGFIHVPYLPEMAAGHAGAPSMSLTVMQRAAVTLLETIRDVRQDIDLTAGAEA
ncbi:MAG: pyroglutamyl-peptidase I [Rhodospirillales bacterium 20-60-12]|nr:MAG: pyroglutamyl-peptidase I [Rhodospirillales bacterium 20-60-12]HQT68268.1 pyroglutamyl-peptidase I [Acetobacteraceae bacterium]